MGGLHCQADQEGREEIRALAGRLAGRRKGSQGLPGILQEAEPVRGPAKGQGDEGKGPGDLSQGLISREISLYANFYGKLLTGNERHLLDEMAKTAGSGHLHHCAGFASQLPVKIACFYSSACCGSAQDHLLVERVEDNWYLVEGLARSLVERKRLMERLSDSRKDVFDLYSHIDLKELKEAYLASIPQ